MKHKAFLIGVATVAAGVLAACGHNGQNSGTTTMPTSTTTTTPTTPTPPASTAVNVTTAELLANYATQPSETATPVPVIAGAFNITDTSDTSAPIGVDGT
jgi:hypothetical protein